MIELYTPHDKQRAVHESQHRYKVLNWGRRSGKSTFAVNYAFMRAIVNQGRYFIIAPTYRQAKSIFWQDIVKVSIPREFIAKMNEQELSVTLKYIDDPKNGIKHNKKLPPSSIELKGAENYDSLRGHKLRGAILDEFAHMPDADVVWNRIIRPSLGDTRGWAIFISTPNGFENEFYEMYKRTQKWPETYFYSHATALDNPHYPKEEWEQTKEETAVEEFEQEWMAKFRTSSLAVYYDFDLNVHIWNKEKYGDFQMPEEGTDLIGLDFGFTNPFAAIFVRLDYDNNWWIYDEIYQPGLTTEKATELLRQKMGGRYYSQIIGDSAAANEIANFKEKNFFVTPSVKGKDSLKAGLRLVSEKLKTQEGTGRPKLFVMPHCENTILEFQKYSRPDKFTETPNDEFNHLMDALRYLALSQAKHREPITRRVKKYDPITGRRIN